MAAVADLRALPVKLAARPRAMAVAGALTIAWSSILVRLSHTSPSTSAIFRCLYALPLLAVLAWREDRRLGARPARDRPLALAAGVFLGIDLLCWHRSIADIGAGLSTVLANLQVAAVPLLAWAVLGERPGRRVLAALPVVLAGIVLISGALERGAYGRDPAAGALFGLLTGLAYAGFILVRLSHTSPSTSAIFRCLYALPVLALLAWREDRRLGPRPAAAAARARSGASRGPATSARASRATRGPASSGRGRHRR